MEFLTFFAKITHSKPVMNVDFESIDGFIKSQFIQNIQKEENYEACKREL